MYGPPADSGGTGQKLLNIYREMCEHLGGDTCIVCTLQSGGPDQLPESPMCAASSSIIDGTSVGGRANERTNDRAQAIRQRSVHTNVRACVRACVQSVVRVHSSIVSTSWHVAAMRATMRRLLCICSHLRRRRRRRVQLGLLPFARTAAAATGPHGLVRCALANIGVHVRRSPHARHAQK